MKKHYRKYTEQWLWESQNTYDDHVSAMTAEGLHSKAEIAAELAWRDALIEDAERRANTSFESVKIQNNRIVEQDDQIDALRRKVTELSEALHWYKTEAEAITKNWHKNDGAVVASAHVLALDNGTRARNALKTKRPEDARRLIWRRDSQA